MSTSTATRSLVFERELPHPPEKVWRALTEPRLIEEWLMNNDFEAVAGRPFTLRADWGSVDCRVLAIEPDRTLSYTWAALGLESVVTWTLTPSTTGTRLRMEHAGFRSEEDANYKGATYGWQKFLGDLEGVVSRLS